MRQVRSQEFQKEVAAREELLAEKIINARKEEQLTSKEAIIKMQNDNEHLKRIISDREDDIARLKDMKSKQSVKLLGENLKQHCEIAFEQLRALGFPRAQFMKDTDAKDGTKGDYIFRDFDENKNEIVSIMFDMKDEQDSTEQKQKNDKHLAKLDKDRKSKKCEYAVLVSRLEQDSELYNGGIVDKSHLYEKMYVIRPQFFIPIITLIRNAAGHSLKYKTELAVIKNQDIDITNFENDLNEWKAKFARDGELMGKSFAKAIEEIDKTMKGLQNTKDNLLLAAKHLGNANNKMEDLTIKRLTKGNPTMQAKFKQAGETSA